MLSKTRLVAAAVAAVSSLSASALADLVVGWTFPTAFPTGTGNVPTGTSYAPPGPNGAGVADMGANFAGSQFQSVHALAAATYTSPAGNGSAYAFSSNNWSTGDYYEARFSAAGFTDLSVSWDQARSSTGPAAFELLMSLDGGATFSTLASYTVLQSGGGGAPGTWSSTTYNPLYSFSSNLGSEANGLGDIILRFRSTVTTAAAGSNRIDSVMINGVPGPGAVALLAAAGLVGSRRRR